jgi:hypothetical protein
MEDLRCRKVLETETPAPTPGAERRKEERQRLVVGVQVVTQDKMPMALGELTDLSAGGAQLLLVAPLEGSC